MNDDLQSLRDHLAAQEIELPDDQLARLDHYRRVLWEWNEKINLTRHTTMEKFVERDVVDSLAFARALAPSERILDVGSGGGVPGVIVAIVRPDVEIHLSESVGKRARVLEDIVKQLGLPCRVHPVRAQEALEDYRFDSLTIRAVASLGKLLGWFEPHWIGIGRLLVLKGPKWVEERRIVRENGQMKRLQLRKLESYQIDPEHGESVLLEIKPKLA